MLSSKTTLKNLLVTISLCFFTLIKPGSPEKTIILWDLNGVLLKSDSSAMLSALWNCSHKWDIIKQSIKTVAQIFHSLSSHPATFEEFIHICKPCNPHLAQLMRTMHGCQKLLSPEMVQLVHELHDQGYTLGIATNMGSETMENLQQKYPEFFANFSIVTTSDTIDPTGTFIKKPDVRYFKLFQERYNKAGKEVIFVDDRKKNAQASEQAGMIGIQFKNHTQLQGELKKLAMRPLTTH